MPGVGTSIYFAFAENKENAARAELGRQTVTDADFVVVARAAGVHEDGGGDLWEEEVKCDHHDPQRAGAGGNDGTQRG